MRNLVKRIVVKLDAIILGGRWVKSRERKRCRIISAAKSLELIQIEFELNEIKKAFKHHIDIGYTYSPSSLLNILCDKYGSDKGETKQGGHPYTWDSHTYTDIYELLFQLRRNDVQLVVECGLGTNNPDIKSSMGVNGIPGASLRVWRDYFPAAKIIGMDIDKNILFQEKRIATYHCDQTSKESIQNFVKAANLKHQSVDVIIDDGLHEFQAGVCLLENLYKYLTVDGYYIIEDIALADAFKYIKYFSKKGNKFNVKLIDLHRPNVIDIENNRLIVITLAT